MVVVVVYMYHRKILGNENQNHMWSLSFKP